MRVEADARRRLARGRGDVACAATARLEHMWEDASASRSCAGKQETRRQGGTGGQTHPASHIRVINAPLALGVEVVSWRAQNVARTAAPARVRLVPSVRNDGAVCRTEVRGGAVAPPQNGRVGGVCV